MPSIEEPVKLSVPPEEFIMLANLPLVQDYKNLSLKLKLPVQLKLWEEYIQYSIKEEDKSSWKNQSKELQCPYLDVTFLSPNLSDLPVH